MVIETKAMGEGAIEGVAADYEIDSSDPFSTAFKFSRFGLTQAAPRDVSKLSGRIVPKAGTLGGAAGGVNDAVDGEAK